MIVQIHKGTVIPNRFEVVRSDFNKEMWPLTRYEKQMYLLPLPRINDIKCFRLFLGSTVARIYVSTTDALLVTQCTLTVSIINSKNLLTKLQLQLFIACEKSHVFVEVISNYFKTIWNNSSCTNVNYWYPFISGKNINSFGRGTVEIFKIFFVELLTGHPVYYRIFAKSITFSYSHINIDRSNEKTCYLMY